MDTTKTITHVSLCAGYGGIDLGLKRAIPSMRTIAFSEIEAFACANLVAKMEAGFLDAAPIWTNLKTFPWDEFRDRVDILSGGYPCQPFSAAGKRLGTEDPRHLWPYIADGIIRMRPRICFFENVEGHITLGLRDVLHDLAGMGFRTTFGIFSASEVGSVHQRKRVFILAHRENIRLSQLTNVRAGWKSLCPTANGGELAHSNEQGLEGCIQRRVTCKEESHELVAGCGGTLANSDSSGSWEDREPAKSRPKGFEQPSGDSRRGEQREIREGQAWPSRPGEPQHGWEPPRVVANTNKLRMEEHGLLNASVSVGSSGGTDGEAMENTQLVGRGGRDHGNAGGMCREIQATGSCGGGEIGDKSDGQTEPTLGRDPDGRTDRLDDAELYTSCDNRTDELRLLGNGVVPATAHKAFITLMEELT